MVCAGVVSATVVFFGEVLHPAKTRAARNTQIIRFIIGSPPDHAFLRQLYHSFTEMQCDILGLFPDGVLLRRSLFKKVSDPNAERLVHPGLSKPFIDLKHLGFQLQPAQISRRFRKLKYNGLREFCSGSQLQRPRLICLNTIEYRSK